MSGARRKLRASGRLLLLMWTFLAAALTFMLHAGPRATFRKRSYWLHRACQRALRGLRVEVRVSGTVPTVGVVAPNHLGYLDILVLAAVAPQVFLAKSEVRSWPVVGWFARWAGTQFIQRGKRSDVARQNADFVHIVSNDAVLTLFLEGTSTDGGEVRPFRSSLLEPAVENHWPITPAALVATCEDGDPAQDVCWWGDMEFAPHLWRMMQVKRIVVHVQFGTTRAPGDERKQLAAELHRDVCALKAGLDQRVAAAREAAAGAGVSAAA